MIIKLENQTVPKHIVTPSLTIEELVTNVQNGDIYDKFRGGVVCSTEEANTATFTKDGKTFKLIDVYPSYPSLDGANIAIRICTPLANENGNWSYKESTTEIFEQFLGFKPITDGWYTLSTFNGLISSAEYLLPIEGVI